MQTQQVTNPESEPTNGFQQFFPIVKELEHKRLTNYSNSTKIIVNMLKYTARIVAPVVDTKLSESEIQMKKPTNQSEQQIQKPQKTQNEKDVAYILQMNTMFFK